MKNKPKSTKPGKGEFADPRSQAVSGLGAGYLFGQKVQPFAPRRMMAAQALGFRFFKMSEAERATLNRENFMYEGMIWDATLVAYLSMCPMSELFRAVRLPETVIENIMNWADEQNIAIGLPAFNEVLVHYVSVIQALLVSTAERVDEKRPGNAQGEVLPGE